MADEIRAADQFIVSKLLADTQLVALVGGASSPRVYHGSAVPQAAITPFVSFSLLSSLDRNALPATITIFTRPIYWVRATVKGRDLTPAYQIVERIDAALRGQFGNVVVGGVTYYVGPWMRNAIRTLPQETDGGQVFVQHGIEVESRVQALT